MGVFYRSRIPAVLTQTNVKAQAAVAATAEMVRQGTDERVPVGATGNLKDSIRIIDGATPYTKHVGLGDGDSFYAHFQEFGTEKQSAQPSLTPAAEAAKGFFVASMRKIA